jgi:NADH dehydrogenase (ubiquinone) Fe-S protein 4
MLLFSGHPLCSPFPTTMFRSLFTSSFSQARYFSRSPAISADLPKATLAQLNGVPEKNLKKLCYIYNPAAVATQSASGKTKGVWALRFAEEERWGHNLMGWTATRDPNHNLKIEFDSQEEAISFAEQNGT